MAASKGKAFSFKNAWAILQTFDNWKLRDQETVPKKAAIIRMDDSDEEERNLCKPEGTKKDKLRKKMEGEASSIREKMEHMMKSRETLTIKTLETKLLIIEKKKEVKLAQVEARHEEAKRKAEERGRKVDLEERMIKDYKEDIAERKRIFRGASSTLRGDTPMSGGGDGGVEDSTTDAYGGA
uniref:No apical meristem-associated C-terminal domain-containing protein n=1 Tax=Hordeum vulgare subsp. vulgare TaxID=112509 RepID=A0A8I6XDV1_HORVV